MGVQVPFGMPVQTCTLCNLLPKTTVFDGLPICNTCYSDITRQFIEYSNKRVPRVSYCTQIDDIVFIGDEDSAHNLQDMKSKGIQRVLIAGAYLHAYHEGEFLYKQIPIQDALEEDLLPFLDEALEFILIGDGNVLVHCAAGVSRSGSIVVAYLMKKYNLSYDDALEMARSKSPRIRPNTSFEKQLRNWENERGYSKNGNRL
jgi:hypothetical protein